MMGRLLHRGPDSSGYYRDKKVGLGHTRLSIIDLETGAQPLSNEDASVWVTFNGEIFNYVELAKELHSRGHIFKTKSDTEVIAHAYEQWGTSCFEHFNGQWALALWDTHNKRLILSRDRHGIRPLFYTRCNNRLLFASEIKAIFADKCVSRELDPAGLLKEGYQIIKGLELESTIFRSNHASNYLSLEGRFPKDKARFLAILESAIEGKIDITPEYMRGL